MKKSRRELQTHRQDIRIKKSQMLVDPAHITDFIKKATTHIPEALVELEKNPTTENLDWFYGLLAGFVICTTGHRRGVISNMTVEEVGTAEADGDGRRIIRVKEHKTKETFGHALVPLTKDEYIWFHRFVYHRHRYPGGSSQLIFANTNGGPYSKMLTSFQDAWRKFGIPGKPTFSMIRSSISTFSGRSLGTQSKVQVHRMMCYSDATAARFYEADLNFDEAFKCRNNAAKALAVKSRIRDSEESTTSEDNEDVLQRRYSGLKKRKSSQNATRREIVKKKTKQHANTIDTDSSKDERNNEVRKIIDLTAGNTSGKHPHKQSGRGRGEVRVEEDTTGEEDMPGMVTTESSEGEDYDDNCEHTDLTAAGTLGSTKGKDNAKEKGKATKDTGHLYSRTQFLKKKFKCWEHPKIISEKIAIQTQIQKVVRPKETTEGVNQTQTETRDEDNEALRPESLSENENSIQTVTTDNEEDKAEDENGPLVNTTDIDQDASTGLVRRTTEKIKGMSTEDIGRNKHGPQTKTTTEENCNLRSEGTTEEGMRTQTETTEKDKAVSTEDTGIKEQGPQTAGVTTEEGMTTQTETTEQEKGLSTNDIAEDENGQHTVTTGKDKALSTGDTNIKEQGPQMETMVVVLQATVWKTQVVMLQATAMAGAVPRTLQQMQKTAEAIPWTLQQMQKRAEAIPRALQRRQTAGWAPPTLQRRQTQNQKVQGPQADTERNQQVQGPLADTEQNQQVQGPLASTKQNQ
ncbi:uncharacterized protein LOC120440226 [Oreochromis aureus]|uniref:uncharacterized protein LOC120440226 n=1 Tax=Oreochromis aureus TaxID=47969 RepID=UPI0019535E1B|nr:uncharacterized protein LOC120440226 [Oreochromis aureus]